MLWLILRLKIGSRYRTWAERFSTRSFLQALIFAPCLLLTIALLELPGRYLSSLSKQQLRALDPGLALVVLGLDQDRVLYPDWRHILHLASVPGHPQESATLVVLFLADLFTDRSVYRLQHSARRRSTVQQVRAAVAKGSGFDQCFAENG